MSFQLDDQFDAVLNIIEVGAQHAANETVDAIADDARENAPVDKGALKAGIYSAPAGDNAAYQAAADAVHKANKSASVSSVGSEDFSSEGVFSATAESIVDYSAAIHNGFGNVSGRPFMENAFDGNEGTFQRNLNDIAGDLRKF